MLSAKSKVPVGFLSRNSPLRIICFSSSANLIAPNLSDCLRTIGISFPSNSIDFRSNLNASGHNRTHVPQLKHRDLSIAEITPSFMMKAFVGQ